MTTAPERLTGARRVVVKIGSALLVDSKTGAIKASWLSSLIDDLAETMGADEAATFTLDGGVTAKTFRADFAARPSSRGGPGAR